mmetsp:Transcript_14612/g.18070  ORF Transcript_14612/g.18070 Transcript_14612/m.18070 type:complete len:83 (-) Transcript_14612:965-1213(-)
MGDPPEKKLLNYFNSILLFGINSTKVFEVIKRNRRVQKHRGNALKCPALCYLLMHYQDLNEKVFSRLAFAHQFYCCILIVAH